MPEVKHYVVAGLVDSSLNPTLKFVTLVDFERVTAERDALQQRLNDRDQRVDELEVQLDEAIKIIDHVYDNYGLSDDLQARIDEFMMPGEEDTTP